MTAGAFDRAGRLVGFVFGMTGLEEGRPVHRSNMLAAAPAARGQGIGRRLTEFQREQQLPPVVETIYRTFDPLVARNAYFNLDRIDGLTIRTELPRIR